MQVPGQVGPSSGPGEGAASRPNTRKVSCFRAGGWRVVMSLEGKRPLWDGQSGVHDDDRRPTND